MREGVTTAAIVKVLLIGPSGSGKTCTKRLLLSLPPPDRRNSTLIATRVARAISMSHITADGSAFVTWKELDNETYLDFIIQEMELLELQSSSEVPMPTTTTSPAPDGNAHQQPSSEDPKKGDQHIPATEGKAATPPRDLSLSDDGGVETVNRIIKKMTGDSNPPQKSQQKQFVHLIDSGGQPNMISLVPAFIRGSAVNVVFTKLNKPLSHNLPSQYVKDDKRLCQTTGLEQTQQEVVEELICSLATVQYSKIRHSKSSTGPKFLIIGTHADKHHPLFSETLTGKNRRLKHKLGELKSVCIESDPHGGIIHPVNTLVKKGRAEVAASIRQKVMEACSNGSEVDIPTRWYIFELEVDSTAKKEGRGVLGLSECLIVGKKVKMGGEDVMAAIVFLDEVTLCIYYKGVPHLVFTDSQAIINEVTELMNLGVIDLKHILSYYPFLADHMAAVRRLRNEGFFNKFLVALMCHEFRVGIEGKCSYTEDDFIAILKHLLIVAPVTINGEEHYFLPSILPTVKKIVPSIGELSPLLLTCCTKVIPLGMFPALVVALLDKSASPQLVLDKCQQYRNAVRLCCPELGGVVSLVESAAWIEVHFSGSAEVASRIRVALHRALDRVCMQQQYDPEKVVFSDNFWCPFTPRCDNVPHPCEVAHRTKWVTCSVKPDTFSESCAGQVKLMAWLRAPAGEFV